MAAYIVTAGSVVAETHVGPGRARVDHHRGAMLPDDVPATEIEDLLRRGHIAEVVEEPAVDEDGDGVPDGTVTQVLAWVDGDPARAAAALAAEAAKGDAARTTLVGELTKLVQPAE